MTDASETKTVMAPAMKNAGTTHKSTCFWGIILNHIEGLKDRLLYPFVPKWDEICCHKYTYGDEKLIPVFHIQSFLYHLLHKHPPMAHPLSPHSTEFVVNDL